MKCKNTECEAQEKGRCTADPAPFSCKSRFTGWVPLELLEALKSAKEKCYKSARTNDDYIAVSYYEGILKKYSNEPKSKWRKISTAPKDGTKILGWNERFGEHETYMTKLHETSAAYQRGLRNSGWHFPDWIEMHCATWEPTLWMELPHPPNDLNQVEQNNKETTR